MAALRLGRAACAALVVVAAVAIAAGIVLVRPGRGVATRAETAVERLLTRVRHQPAPLPTETPLPGSVLITVDPSQVLHPISPLIYGVGAGNQAALSATGAYLNRWGGNAVTRYNWTLGTASNAARDWLFADIGGPPAAPSQAADAQITLDRSRGVESVITIPAIGWVARDGDNATRSVDVPADGGPPLGPGSDAIAGYDPTANRLATSVPSFARKGAPFEDPPAPVADQVFQDEWVHHLVDRFGTAQQGGVAYYVVDNEPDLWSVTHTDIHPVEADDAEMLSTFVTYADAIKDVDPTAQVLGPAVSGWDAYFYSARDRGTDKYQTHADRLAHDDMPFLPWWLDQVRHHDQATGRRSLDVLDVHYYPQAAGVYGGATDAATNQLRLRSTRALWDPSYVDESWIAEPVDLIPRLRAWIDHYYPGTRLAINEWNWGADSTVNGALAIADVLGIYGREGVDMAAYWTSPPVGSPGAAAFSMYTNVDGEGHGFGDLAVQDTSSAPDAVSSYASLDAGTGDLLVMLINKRPDAAVATTLRIPSAFADGAELFQYDGTGGIQDLGQVTGTATDVTMDVPPYSISLLRFPPTGSSST